MSNNLTYAKSGVNIRSADKFIRFISKITSKQSKNPKNNNIGNFGSVTKLPNKLKNVHLVAATDGVGTKIEIANEYNKFDTIGIDMVAMSVNDILVQGGKPFVFLDYISINKIDQKKLKNIFKGIHKGCKISGWELVGGETAEMPGTYSEGKFDITLVVATKKHSLSYGSCQLDRAGNFKKIIEKPYTNHLVNIGLYLLKPSIIKMVSKNESISMDGLLTRAKKRNKKVNN